MVGVAEWGTEQGTVHEEATYNHMRGNEHLEEKVALKLGVELI